MHQNVKFSYLHKHEGVQQKIESITITNEQVSKKRTANAVQSIILYGSNE